MVDYYFNLYRYITEVHPKVDTKTMSKSDLLTLLETEGIRKFNMKELDAEEINVDAVYRDGNYDYIMKKLNIEHLIKSGWPDFVAKMEEQKKIAAYYESLLVEKPQCKSLWIEEATKAFNELRVVRARLIPA